MSAHVCSCLLASLQASQRSKACRWGFETVIVPVVIPVIVCYKFYACYKPCKLSWFRSPGSETVSWSLNWRLSLEALRVLDIGGGYPGDRAGFETPGSPVP